MRRALFLLIAVVAIFAACESGGVETEYVYIPYDPGVVVGDVQVIGTWVRETTGEGRRFYEDGTFGFTNENTGEIYYSGTWYAEDGTIYFVEEDGTEFEYLYYIQYDDPSAGNASIYLSASWISEPLYGAYRRIIPGMFEYP